VQQPKPFRFERGGELKDPGHVAARPIQTRDEAKLRGVATDRENDWDRRRRLRTWRSNTALPKVESTALPALAADLVRRGVAVLVVSSPNGARNREI